MFQRLSYFVPGPRYTWVEGKSDNPLTVIYFLPIEERTMDGTRLRRTLDPARQGWYSRWRSLRFARHLGFALAPLLHSRTAMTAERRPALATAPQVA
jgi:hypothetical protein